MKLVHNATSHLYVLFDKIVYTYKGVGVGGSVTFLPLKTIRTKIIKMSVVARCYYEAEWLLFGHVVNYRALEVSPPVSSTQWLILTRRRAIRLLMLLYGEWG